MANNPKTAAIKTEFVDVITKGGLVSSPVSATFSTIITEASLVETSSTDILTNGEIVITLYDEVFVGIVKFTWVDTVAHKTVPMFCHFE